MHYSLVATVVLLDVLDFRICWMVVRRDLLGEVLLLGRIL